MGLGKRWINKKNILKIRLIMTNLIIGKLVSGLAGALISSALLYGVYDYIELKSSYSKAQKTITLMRDRSKNIKLIMNKVENEKAKIDSTQHKYLLQIERNGYVNSDYDIVTGRLRKDESRGDRP